MHSPSKFCCRLRNAWGLSADSLNRNSTVNFVDSSRKCFRATYVYAQRHATCMGLDFPDVCPRRLLARSVARARVCSRQVQRHGGHPRLHHGGVEEGRLSGVRGNPANDAGRPGQDPRLPGGGIVSSSTHVSACLSFCRSVCLFS